MTSDAGSGYKYGSVSNDEESGDADENKNFDESNLYYYKEGELTSKEKLAKALKLAVPIFIAVLLIGGLAFMLFHNFGYFYPGRGGSHAPSKHSSGSSVSSTTTTERSYQNNEAPSLPFSAATTFGSACGANPKCADRGLIGECCPTEGGISLDCCS